MVIDPRAWSSEPVPSQQRSAGWTPPGARQRTKLVQPLPQMPGTGWGPPTTQPMPGTLPMLGQGQDSPYPAGWDPNDYYDPNAPPMVPGNIDLNNRPVVRNPDGSISTVRSMSFGDETGAETLVPTIGPRGDQWDNQQAIDNYYNTGQHLGKFNSATAATNYAQQLHEDQANQYAPASTGVNANPPQDDRGWPGAVSDWAQQGAQAAGDYVQHQLRSTPDEAASRFAQLFPPNAIQRGVQLRQQADTADASGDPEAIAAAEEAQNQHYLDLALGLMGEMHGQQGAFQPPRPNVPRPPLETKAAQAAREAESARVAGAAQAETTAGQALPYEHNVGSGYVQGASPETSQSMAADVTRREFPQGVSQEESNLAGIALGLDPARMAELDQRINTPGATAQAAAESAALRTRMVGAREAVAGLRQDVDTLHRVGDPSSLDDVEKIGVATRLLRAAESSAVLAGGSSRRYAEALGRGLAQYQYRIVASAAQDVVDRIQLLSTYAKRMRGTLDAVRSGQPGRLSPRQIGDLDALAGSVERSGDLLDQTNPRVRETRSRLRDAQNKQQGISLSPERPQTLAEQLGALEREHMAAHGDEAAQAELGTRRDALLEQIRADAEAKAQDILAKQGRDWSSLSPEEAERIVNQAIGSPTVSTLNSEALKAAREAAGTEPNPIQRIIQEIKNGERQAVTDDRATVGYWMRIALDHPEDMGLREAMHQAIDTVATHGLKGQRLAVQLREQFSQRLTSSYDRLMQSVQSRNAQAAARDRATIETVIDKLTVQDMSAEARDTMRQITQFPSDNGFKTHFYTLLDDMRLTGERGTRTADALAQQLEDRTQQSYEQLMAGVNRRNVEDITGGMAASERNFDKLRQQSLIQEIHDLTAAARTNPDILSIRDAFGDSRLARLQEDLMLVANGGADRATALREQGHKAGVLHLMQKAKASDDVLDPMLRMLSGVRTDTQAHLAEDLGKVVRTIRQPRFIDYAMEYQFINMLSGPVTHMTNIAGNTLNIAGRLASIPLEALGDVVMNAPENRATGGMAELGAALRGGRQSIREGWQQAGQVMRTGQRPDVYNQALETSNLGGIRREFLTERFGPVGVILHSITTRPLEAADVLLGHIAYGSAVEQAATRKAAVLLQRGEIPQMPLELATQHVLANIWDHPDVPEKAGKIRDYTLLRGTGENPTEHRVLQALSGLRNAPIDAGLGRQAVAFFANMIVPFFNVPYNYIKQGLDRSPAGIGYNALRAVTSSNPEARAEHFARATVATTALLTAELFMAGGNLTGDGPTDPQRKQLWLETHRPNSIRLPSGGWVSWESTPWAIPFAIVANMHEKLNDAQELAGRQGLSGVDTVLKGAEGATQGVKQGILSNTFLQSVRDTLSTQPTIEKGVAGEASRFVPLSSMLRTLARIGDGMERDVRSPSGVENITNRLSMGLPGARQTLPPSRDVLGRPVPNQSAGVAGLLPFRPGGTPNEKDPIIAAFTAFGIPLARAPLTVSPGDLPGGAIKLTRDEQVVYMDNYRKLLEYEYRQLSPAEQFRPDALNKASLSAANLAKQGLMAPWSPQDIQKRMTLTADQEKKVDDPKSYRQGLGLAADRLADPRQYPHYLNERGEAVGTPSVWDQWDKQREQAHGQGRMNPVPEQIRLLDEAAARAKGVNTEKMQADPRYDDWKRWFGTYAGLTKDEATQLRTHPEWRYDSEPFGAALTPNDADTLDKWVDLYRAYPRGDPRKYDHIEFVKMALRAAKTEWKQRLDPDGSLLRELSGIPQARDALVAP